jgi:hypothetical protein
MTKQKGFKANKGDKANKEKVTVPVPATLV